MRISPLMVLATLAMLTLSSCFAVLATAQTAAPLTNTTWTLVEYNGRDFDANGSYNVIFKSDKTASGVADCNSFTSRYSTSSNGRISITSLGLTRAMCQNDRMETIYINLLEDGDSYSISGNKMNWYDGGRLVAVFRANNFVVSTPAPVVSTQSAKEEAKAIVADAKAEAKAITASAKAEAAAIKQDAKTEATVVKQDAKTSSSSSSNYRR